MEFHIVREHLFKLLNRLQSVAERRNTMPILGYTLLSAETETLTLSATDLEVSILTSAPAEVAQPGQIAVLAKKLYEVVRELPENVEIHLKRDPDTYRLNLVAGRAKFTLAGVAPEEFPELPDADGYDEFTMKSEFLANQISKTHFAISLEETRATLSSALIQCLPANGEVPSKVRVVATDTHRLAMADHPIDTTASQPMNAMLPRKSILELRKMLEEDPLQEVRVVIGDNHLQAIKPGITLISKLVAGKYPNYHRVIPTQNTHALLMEKEVLKGAVKRMAVLSNEKSQGIQLEISHEMLRLSSDNPEREIGEEELVAEYEGPPLKVGFNVRYLLDILNAMDGATVRFLFNNEETPVVVTDPTQAENLLYVLMPIRV